MAITSANQLELLQTAEAVAREKMIEPGLVVEAMEESLARAAKSRYGSELDIRVSIDRKTGRATFTRVRTVTDPEILENDKAEMPLEEATGLIKGDRPNVVVFNAKSHIFDEEGELVATKDVKRFVLRAPTENDRLLTEDVDQNVEPVLGDLIADEVPPVEMGRIAAQSAKQVILQKVREAERDRQYEEFKDRAGQIINGVVKREEYGNVIVDVGAGEAQLRRNEKIGREAYRNGDRIRCYIKDVRRENRGHQIFLSRTAPEFMAELFKMEVPEIYDGIIDIKAVARDPGSRAKIAVISYDNSIDPVGACVGMRGSRVQAVVNELQGEKIDIIPWNEDQPTFLVNALQPAEVSKVVLDEEAERIEVVVPDEQLSLAIGRRGQNVRLASQLTNLDIDIMTEEEESKRRQAEFELRTKLFMDSLDLDEFFAQLLVAEGFTNLEEVAYVPLEELASIEGFDEDLGEELQNRAKEAIDRQEATHREARRELGVEDDLAEMPHLNEGMLVTLGKAGIKTLDDLADLATDELIAKKREAPRRRAGPDGGPPMRRPAPREQDKGGVLGEYGLTEEQGNEIIMAARAHWFEDEEPVAAAADEPDTQEAANADSDQ